mmetsp:Transcript_32608/g.96109  ORF Transcript_32608/g.96109 Transcript_32608/m.96109 type:complete len:270 (-) Transcript_32608:176-985(-)
MVLLPLCKSLVPKEPIIVVTWSPLQFHLDGGILRHFAPVGFGLGLGLGPILVLVLVRWRLLRIKHGGAIVADEQAEILANELDALDLGDRDLGGLNLGLRLGLGPGLVGRRGSRGLHHLPVPDTVLDALRPALAGDAVEDPEQTELGGGVDRFLLEEADDAVETLPRVPPRRDGTVHDVPRRDELGERFGREAREAVERPGVQVGEDLVHDEAVRQVGEAAGLVGVVVGLAPGGEGCRGNLCWCLCFLLGAGMWNDCATFGTRSLSRAW